MKFSIYLWACFRNVCLYLHSLIRVFAICCYNLQYSMSHTRLSRSWSDGSGSKHYHNSSLLSTQEHPQLSLWSPWKKYQITLIHCYVQISTLTLWPIIYGLSTFPHLWCTFMSLPVHYSPSFLISQLSIHTSSFIFLVWCFYYYYTDF